MELQNDMKKLTAVFEKLHTYISLLALPSKHLLAAMVGTFEDAKTSTFQCYLIQVQIEAFCRADVVHMSYLYLLTEKSKMPNDVKVMER